MNIISDISIPLLFNAPQPNAFDVDAATARVLGDTRDGASVNFEQYTFIPHCNGTHTECVGHIAGERISIRDCLQDVMMPAVLVTVEPERIGVDLVITRKAIADKDVREPYEALIIRTLPNDEGKQTRRYDSENVPPYFAADAIDYIVECGFRHLLVDLPSLDRLDDPTLPAHRAFWNVEMGSREVNTETRINSTITELIYVPNEIADGEFMLNLQIAPFEADCSPSRPLLLTISPHLQ
ncbi:MAG TPA: cyclase family protein [Pyrinomonadaceae bacterium]|nr:cyclase family protein [Pyrinomonadaceae bacterium]